MKHGHPGLFFLDKHHKTQHLHMELCSILESCSLSISNIDLMFNLQVKGAHMDDWFKEIEELNKELSRKHPHMESVAKHIHLINQILDKYVDEIGKNTKKDLNPQLEELLEAEFKKLSGYIDRLNNIQDELKKEKHGKSNHKVGKGINHLILSCAMLMRKICSLFKLRKKKREDNTPLVNNAALYAELDKLFDEHKMKLTEKELHNAQRFFGALRDLNDNAEDHLSYISKEYRKKLEEVKFLYLGKPPITPFHIECYNPRDRKYYKGISVKTAMSSFHLSMENILKWAKENNRLADLFKNIPGGVCIDGNMRALEDWVSKVSQPELDIDTGMEVCLDRYAKYKGASHEYQGKKVEKYGDLEDKDLYVEDVAAYIMQNIGDEPDKIKIKGGVSLEMIEQYLEDNLALDRRDSNVAKRI